MKKIDTKRKEAVKLRQRLLSNGSYSLYLDMYWKGERDYDYLNLYLSESTNAAQREQNKNTLLLAEQIKAQRLLELQNGRYKIKQSKMDASFLEHFDKMTKARYNCTIPAITT